MKFRILFLAAALVVAGMSAIVAQADAVNDPLVRINRGGDATDYDPSVDGPLTQAFDPSGFSLSFEYTGDTPLTSLTFLLTGVPVGPPPELFQCISDIWSSCLFGVDGPSVNGFVTEEFFFSGGSLPAFNPDDPGASAFTTDVVVTPEPSTMILFMSGLVLLFAFGKKRWRMNRSEI